MNRQLWNRLDNVQQDIGVNARNVLVMVWADESSGIAEEKIARWKAGEVVKGIDTDPYEGGEVIPLVIHFVSTSSPNTRFERSH